MGQSLAVQVAQELAAAEKLAAEAAARKAAEQSEALHRGALEKVRREGEEEVQRLKAASKKAIASAENHIQVFPHLLWAWQHVVSI